MTKQTLLMAATAAVLLAGAGQASAQEAGAMKPATETPATPATPATPTTPAAPATPTTETPATDPAAAKLPGAAPAVAFETPAAPPAPTVVAKGDMVETLRASGQFTILIKALDATNLTPVLKTNQNLTLFAPTDAAFKALPAGQLDKLLASPAELQKLLTYHLVNAPVESAKVDGTTGEVQSVGGAELKLDDTGDNLMVGDATVLQADIRATNGIVHVINKVIMPGAAPTEAAPAQ